MLTPPLQTQWQRAPAQLPLPPEEVHLWRACLDERLAAPQKVLSVEERTRATRFLSLRDRERYIHSHAIVRFILSRYLGIAPEDLVFNAGPHGKPALAPPERWLNFNLSHSENWMLLAVTAGREVGVDLEWMRTNVSIETLAKRYLRPEDAEQLERLPLEQQAAGFYGFWTAMEARLKAAGTGFLVEENEAERARWHCHHLVPVEGFAGAVAVEGVDLKLRCFSWPE